MGNFILEMDQIGADNRDTAGLLAVEMAALRRKGLPVPEAFCLSAEAYAKRIEALGLEDKLRDHWSRQVDEDALAKLAEQAKDAIISDGVGEALREAIDAAAGRLGTPLVNVAVSPALASHDATSIAGVGWQADFLPREAAAEAAAECWASLWGARQLVFRMRAGIEPGPSAPWGMAVMVAAAEPAPLRGSVDPTDIVGDGAGSWVVNVDPRIPSEDEIALQAGKEEKTGSPLTASQAEALMILATGASAAVGELRSIRWNFDGSRFTITGLRRPKL